MRSKRRRRRRAIEDAERKAYADRIAKAQAEAGWKDAAMSTFEAAKDSRGD
ncbi:MAG: hypothetical protein IPL01_19785 [Acidobacteria bacterium]|nr:hypothetical protein [Acidobacteriota bacterium]